MEKNTQKQNSANQEERKISIDTGRLYATKYAVMTDEQLINDELEKNNQLPLNYQSTDMTLVANCIKNHIKETDYSKIEEFMTYLCTPYRHIELKNNDTMQKIMRNYGVNTAHKMLDTIGVIFVLDEFKSQNKDTYNHITPNMFKKRASKLQDNFVTIYKNLNQSNQKKLLTETQKTAQEWLSKLNKDHPTITTWLQTHKHPVLIKVCRMFFTSKDNKEAFDKALAIENIVTATKTLPKPK